MGLAFASRAFWQLPVVLMTLALALTCGGCGPDVQQYEREQNIPGLIELLCRERTDEGLRTEVAQALGRIGEPSVEPLLAKLEQLFGGDKEHPTPEKVCEEAVMDALYRVGEPAVDRLIEALASGTFMADDARKVLVRIGEPAVEPVIASLRDDIASLGDDIGDSSFLHNRMKTLGSIGDPRAIEPLVDVVARCRATAENSFCRRGAIAAAITALQDIDDPRVSAMAPVASGQGVSAAQFDPTARGPHRLILLDPDGKATDWTYTVPQEWLPGSPQETQLVCIARVEVVTLDPAYYTGGVVRSLYRQDLVLSLREAVTGTEVASTVIRGQAPDGRSPVTNATLFSSERRGGLARGGWRWHGDAGIDR